MGLSPAMSDVDRSTDCLISGYHDVNLRTPRKSAGPLKIALWVTVVLSSMLAVTAIALLISTSCSSGAEMFDDDEVAPQLADTVRVVASRRAAKVIVTRSNLQSLELDIWFHGSEGQRDEDTDEPPRSCEGEVAGSLQCVSWPGPHGARLTLSELDLGGRTKCLNFSMLNSDPAGLIKVCVPLKGRQLYGGPTVYEQRWPSNLAQPMHNITYLSGYNGTFGVVERYWITSKGEAFYFPPDVPLFMSQDEDKLCLESRLASPYHRAHASSVDLKAVLCSADDARSVFLATSRGLLGTPSAPPDELMLRYPVWSTWARFKKDVTAQKVLQFASEINHYGFPNSQLEIDDNWEYCYGFSDFNNKTFPDANATVSTLHQLGFRVTLWMHPFENKNCYTYLVSSGLGLLVKRPEDNATDAVRWWDGQGGLLDFNIPLAAQWFGQRLDFLKKKFNVDGFKFDAGEASFVPPLAMLHGPEELQPASLPMAYARTVAEANPGMAEMRSPFMAQRLPIVVRMGDKDSVWGYHNGLKTLIPSLLTLNMVGYSTIMPDMIGGNGYGDKPDKELFIRWLQASTFMPVMQFSYSPWDFDNETVVIAKKYVDLHANYSNLFIRLAHKKMKDGSPINPPLWWIAPHDKIAQTIDSEFLLGEGLLVAPVLQKGATSRDVYLPAGKWREGLQPRGKLLQGPLWLRNHSAPLGHLPFFERV